MRLSGAGTAPPAARVVVEAAPTGHRLRVDWPDGSRREALIRADEVTVASDGD
ncbi:hypothetical protein [Streptomyces sp. NPDC047453]|uniref:hypothetical protein n=1 Tax=Streptomyces sp. NPDC047453 TaxID=3154812 RepID=UPI0033E2C68A